jgi:hypothetical protein
MHAMPSLRANGSRERAPDDRLREAIHLSDCRAMDCFVASAPRNDGGGRSVRRSSQSEGGPGIPEAVVIEPRSRGVLDLPHSRV